MNVTFSKRNNGTIPASAGTGQRRIGLGAPTGGRTILLGLAIVLALALHLYAVYTIARQPLGLNQQPGAERSLIWPLHNDTIHRVGPGADLFAVYHAGQAIRQGESVYIRDLPADPTPYFYPFRYLPIVGQTVGLLLTSLTPQTAYRMWILVLEAALGLFLTVLLRRTAAGWMRPFAICLLLLSSPYLLELHMGQFTFLTMALLGIALLLVEDPRGWATGLRAQIAAAAAYTTAVLLKVVPAVTAPALLRHRRHWPSLALAATAVLGTALPYFAQHPDDVGTFLTNFAAQGGGLDAGNVGPTYLLYRLADDLAIGWLTEQWSLLLLGGRFLLLTLTAVLVLLRQRRQIVVGASALLLAHFVSYIHVWEHHMSGVIVIGLLLLRESVRSNHDQNRARTIAIAASLLLLALPTPFALFDRAQDPAIWDPSVGWPAYARYAVLLPKAVPTIVLYLVSLAALCRPGAGEPT